MAQYVGSFKSFGENSNTTAAIKPQQKDWNSPSITFDRVKNKPRYGSSMIQSLAGSVEVSEKKQQERRSHHFPNDSNINSSGEVQVVSMRRLYDESLERPHEMLIAEIPTT